jgi:hypothetical protein
LEKMSQEVGTMRGGEEEGDVDDSVSDPEEDAEKMPLAGDSDGVASAGDSDPGGEVAGVLLGGVHAVGGHFDGGEADPLGAGRAVDVPIEARMVH